VFAGVLRMGMTSSRADTRTGSGSSIICFSTTLRGPIVARSMWSGPDAAGAEGRSEPSTRWASRTPETGRRGLFEHAGQSRATRSAATNKDHRHQDRCRS
jgi:hypothetical protein